MNKNGTPKTTRCAIYTRKSTDEGLDQEFNSLDAQRQAGELYIASQKSEGWICLPQRYDDGGFSGGNIERPALKRMLDDIAAGEIDLIVVYKVDRLSRSLMDFAKIIELFERHNVAFVSVTQQFNTGNSMGRLVLNVLLSFAQFERDIISERTRDKMAATRRKGQYTGGCLLLGYDVAAEGGGLIINEAEAEKVRQIFKLYLEIQSLTLLAQEIEKCGWCNKRWETRQGHMTGGQPLGRMTLYNMLKNYTYNGRVNYKGQIYQGVHKAIIDDDTFERVQTLLHRNPSAAGLHARNRHGALLKGMVRCVACDCLMTPSHSVKKNADNSRKIYRYYYCTNARRNGHKACRMANIPAVQIEQFVIDQIKGFATDEGVLEEVLQASQKHQKEIIQKLESECRILKRESIEVSDTLQKLLTQKPVDIDCLAAAQERSREIELLSRRIDQQLEATKSTQIERDEVKRVCEEFDSLWETLTTREQARILHLIVERVDFDNEKSTISIALHSNGIESLLSEFNKQKENKAK